MEREIYDREVSHAIKRAQNRNKKRPQLPPPVSRRQITEMREPLFTDIPWNPSPQPYAVEAEENRWQKWHQTYNKGMCPLTRSPPWAGVTRPSYKMYSVEYGMI
jgi:hypothetical protein